MHLRTDAAEVLNLWKTQLIKKEKMGFEKIPKDFNSEAAAMCAVEFADIKKRPTQDRSFIHYSFCLEKISRIRGYQVRNRLFRHCV